MVVSPRPTKVPAVGLCVTVTALQSPNTTGPCAVIYVVATTNDLFNFRFVFRLRGFSGASGLPFAIVGRFNTDGNGKVVLAQLRGKPVVLYFYPKDDTSGCTAEACGFRDSFPDYGGTGAVVIGISKDSVASHDKFKKKHELPFILASDAGSDVCEKYGVWVEKSMYGRKYMGIERSTFVIDAQGKIAQIFSKAKPEGHAAQVLESLAAE